MPFTIPPFVQYQAPLFPLRALWENTPPEGPMFVSVEVDWAVTTPPAAPAVQVALSGNSPVAFSQIVALAVDNARCGADVQFIFTDSGFVLVVPAYCQGVFPVFTNALMFYIVGGSNVAAGDVTTCQVLNSMPPPVAILPSQEQSNASVAGMNLAVNGTATIVPAGVTGTLTGFVLVISGDSTSGGECNFALVDGTGRTLWNQTINFPAGLYNQTVPATGIRVRFFNGLNAVITGTSGITAGNVAINAFYSVP